MGAVTSGPLADAPHVFEEFVEHASVQYGIDRRLIISDYWLIRTLHAWASAVGDGRAQRRYPDPGLGDAENRVGQFGRNRKVLPIAAERVFALVSDARRHGR